MQIRVKRGKLFVLILLAIASGFLFSLQNVCAASEVQFGQAILPVRFVYLNRQGNIGDIWSNVSPSDSEYVVKFFDEKKLEVSPSKKLFAQYMQKGEETVVDARVTQCTQLIEKNNSIEEIRTIV